MKIEKLSDNQIRCTLTRADLAERQLQLSELAYGTEKARSLFHDMMQQAAQEFGFEAENMPLMIEAIPSSSDSIVLIILKSRIQRNSTRVFLNSHLFRGRMEILPVKDSLTNWKVLNLFLICLAKSKRRLMLHKFFQTGKSSQLFIRISR